jgi:hypothetical protein
MNSPVANPIPEFYLLWHPSCELGEFLAGEIHDWLRPGKGLGPQVFYRSLPAPESPPGGLPSPLPGELRPGAPITSSWSKITNLQVIVLLVDENMIADAAWRQWLSQIATAKEPPRVFIPVALDSTAFNIVAPLRQVNFLRPTGLPMREGVVSEQIRDSSARSLIKQLTEALCRLLLGGISTAGGAATPKPAIFVDGTAAKIKIFLSHAKADGTTPAKRIREYIYSQTQLAAFYDENDIPFGSLFGQVLQTNLQADQTAALISVRSAQYASRPWCRRELSLFRQPLREPKDNRSAEQWRLSPVVVVDALEPGHRSVGIPELGNAPLIRWSDESGEQEQQIVTTLLREVVLGIFHSALGRQLDGPNHIILNWLPDPTTLLCILRKRPPQELTVIYPGRGLSGLELDILDGWFPQIEFRSFEEVLS